MFSRFGALLCFALAAFGATVRLYLKDGTYQWAREYQVLQDRVKYYSTERGEWEEIPLEMVDLDRTRKESAEREDAIKAEAKAQTEAKARAKAEGDARRRATQQLESRLNSAYQSLSKNLSSGTTIEPLGPGGEPYADYGQVVKSYYDQAWIDPEDVSEDAATVKVKVVIGRDGSVNSDSIMKRSGVPALDKSVQNALDRVRLRGLPPFPEGAKESQRTYIINFNLKAKRLVG